MVSQTSGKKSLKLDVKQKGRGVWRIVREWPRAPAPMKYKLYEYTSPGRHYWISFYICYDVDGPFLFGPIHLREAPSGKTQRFNNYAELKKYLEKKKVPLEGLEELANL